METNINKITFNNSDIGQKITCRINGNGIIVDYRKYNEAYPLVCEFLNKKGQKYDTIYTKEGYYMEGVSLRFIYFGHDIDFSVVEDFRDSNSINELDKVIALNEPGRI